jgi:predicted ArsR family transcriptional regulator
MLAEAVERSQTDGISIQRAVDGVARAEGARLAEEIGSRLQTTAGRGRSRRRRAVLGVLETHGFEPWLAQDGTVVLRNCPFHQLAQQLCELICNMNLCLLHAALDNVGETGFDARLDPEEGLCCVKLYAPR